MMYLAAKHTATSPFGKIIQAWTYWPWYRGPRYCHVEVLFSDGYWFSSREFKGAVSFLPGPPPGESADMYHYFPLPFTREQEIRLRTWAEKERFRDDGSPCRYDVRGVLFSFLPIPIGWQSAEDWFCSEIVSAMFQTEGWFAGYSAAAVSPRKCVELYKKEILLWETGLSHV